jgi:hypothetical protein
MPRSALGFRGVVYDEGSTIVLDGSSALDRPFGCYRGQFDAPVELEPEASQECVQQSLTTTLERQGDTWSGTLTFLVYKKRLAPPTSAAPSATPPALQPVAGWTVEKTRWPVTIGPESMVGQRSPKR